MVEQQTQIQIGSDHSVQFSILKGIAIVLVVLSHSGCPGWLGRFVFQFHVPVFFICAGYFFKTHYLDNGLTYIGRRFRGLYLPFLRWSLFFLVIHNLLFPLGLLSEHYGNAGGGVLHPYSWQVFCQRLWSITFNMSGYDEFLAGAFWFFRALFLASLAWFFSFKLMRVNRPETKAGTIAVTILCFALLLAGWQAAMGLRMTGVAQGGYRELMGLSFMAVGFLFREYGVRLPSDWRTALPAFLLLCAGAAWFPVSMGYRASFLQFLPLLPVGIAGFIVLKWVAGWLERLGGVIASAVAYIGDRTLYVFAFHLLAFKLVSAIAVAYYGLPWEKMGSHTVVAETVESRWFFLLYTFVGVAVPLLWLSAYRLLERKYNFTMEYSQLFNMNFLVNMLRRTWLVLRAIGKVLYKGILAIFTGLWQGLKTFMQGIRDVISASNPEDE